MLSANGQTGLVLSRFLTRHLAGIRRTRWTVGEFEVRIIRYVCILGLIEDN